MENEELPLMPVRRLHNFAYCPRLFYLQWVENIFVENADTVEGSHVHRNTDRPSHWQEDLDLAERASLRSLSLDSEALGLTGVVDLIEDTGSGRELLDYKKGAAKRDDHGKRVVKENDALQVAAYALLLEEAGLTIERASVYYAAERSRVSVELTRPLFRKVTETLAAARELTASKKCPPPLKNDPRCLHCSAYPVCLPNESAYWSGEVVTPTKDKEPPRPHGDEGEVLVVQEPKAYLSCRGGEVHVKLDGKAVSKHPIEQLQSVYLYGGVQFSTQLLHTLIEKGVPIAFFSPAGRFIGTAAGLPQSGIDARLGQARVYANSSFRLAVAREMIKAKIHNQRVLLMRNGDPGDGVLKKLAKLRDACSTTESLDSLRGLEGAAAATYFGDFGTMLKGTAGDTFDFKGRNRRPPKDPLNALLSQGYSILSKEIAGICHAVGLDPFIGVYHQPRFGRPALALDLMEEFRPLIADSVALMLLNRQELDRSDFVFTSRGVFLNDSGRRQFWRAWFRRLDSEVTHPQFGYRMSYRRMLDVQVRQLWRYLRGEATTYVGFTTR